MELSPETLGLAVAWFLVFLFSTTLHEAAHAAVALRLGDSTAYQGGQVSLNPLPHIRREPFGMVLVPLISFFMSGWMFGWASAPYDPAWSQRWPKRAGLMALAGPVANFSISILAAIGIRIGFSAGLFEIPSSLSWGQMVQASETGSAGLATILSLLFSLNLILGVFNLLPLPPMDGSAVIQLLLPDEMARKLQDFYRMPMLGFMGILIAWNIFPVIFGPIFGFALGLLYSGVG